MVGAPPERGSTPGMRNPESMPHRTKDQHLTAQKLDRAREALATLLRCEEVSGFAVQDLERSQRTIGGLYRLARDGRR